MHFTEFKLFFFCDRMLQTSDEEVRTKGTTNYPCLINNQFL